VASRQQSKIKKRKNIWTNVPGSWELLIHHHHIFSKRGTACTHSKSGMVAYLNGVHTSGVHIVIILVCVTNFTSNIHVNKAT